MDKILNLSKAFADQIDLPLAMCERDRRAFRALLAQSIAEEIVCQEPVPEREVVRMNDDTARLVPIKFPLLYITEYADPQIYDDAQRLLTLVNRVAPRHWFEIRTSTARYIAADGLTVQGGFDE